MSSGEGKPCAFAAESSESGTQDLVLIHQVPTGHAPGYNEQCVNRRQPANTIYSVCHAQGVTGVTELSAWQPHVCGLRYRSI